MSIKGLSNNNILDFLILGFSGTFSIFFLQQFDVTRNWIYLFISILSTIIFYVFTYKVVHDNYDIMLITLFAKIMPIILLLIMSVLFLKRKLKIIDLFLGTALIIAGVFFVEK
jgi:drug/metabolite transporter (DMT)-like permease